MRINSSPLSSNILSILQTKRKPTDKNQNKVEEPTLTLLQLQSENRLTKPGQETTSKLPKELIGKIFGHVVTPYISETSSQHLASFMTLNRLCLAEVNSLLIPDTAIRSGWITDQRAWGEGKIMAIAKNPSLEPEQVQADVEQVLLKMQHVAVELTNTNASSRGIKLENSLAVLKALSTQTHLKSLELDLFHAFKTNPETLVKTLGEILANNSKLSQIFLYLEDNNIKAAHMDTLGQALSGKSFSCLGFMSNLVGDEGVSALTAYLPQMTVRELCLRSIGMTDQGIEHLVKAWPKGLQILNLESNNISDNGVRKLLDGLSQTSIEKISLQKNALSDAQKKALKENASIRFSV